MWRDSRLAFVVALSVGFCIPLAHVEWFNSPERISYVLRSLEWAGELQRGHLYPRWCPDFYGGFGSPLFQFYAPVPYATAALLTATFLDPFSSLKVVALLASVASGVGMYALVFGETRQRDAALLSAVAFLSAPYRLADLFERGDIGEFACLGLIPISLALYRAVAREARPQRARALAAIAAGFQALVIMTHPILGLWGTAVTGVVVAVSALVLARRGMPRRALMLIGALAIAPGLAAIYVVPAVSYRTAAHTAKMITGFYDPQTHWIFLRTLFQDDVLGTRLPGRIYQFAPILVAAPVAVALGWLRNARAVRPALAWLAGAAVLIALMMPQASWFWAPGRIPFAVFIQFPWRLIGLAVLTTCMALGIGAAAVFDRAPEWVRAWISVAGAAAFVLGMGLPRVLAYEKPTKDIPADPESIRQRILSATDADEYLPAAVAAPPRQPRGELVQSAEGASVAHVFSDGSAHALALHADRGGATVILGLYGFPGWKVDTESGPGSARLDADAGGRLRLSLPSAGTYHVRVWYGATPAGWLGGILSALSVLAIGLFLSRGTRLWPGLLLRRRGVAWTSGSAT